MYVHGHFLEKWSQEKKYFSEIIESINKSTTIEKLCENDKQYERHQFVRTKLGIIHREEGCGVWDQERASGLLVLPVIEEVHGDGFGKFNATRVLCKGDNLVW